MIEINNKGLVRLTGKERKKLPDIHLILYLGEEVKIADDLTFANFMELLYINRKMINLVFASSLGFHKLENYVKEMRKPIPRGEGNDHKNEVLEVYFHPDMWKYEKDKSVDICPYYGFHMIKFKDEDGDNIPYSISLSSLNVFKKHKLRLGKDVTVQIYDASLKGAALRKNIQTSVKAELGSIKLFDFIHAILDEISYHGKPSDKKAFASKLEKTIYDYKDSKK